MRRRLPTALSVFFLVLAVVRASVDGATSADQTSGLTAKEIAQGYREDVILARPRPAHRATVDRAETGEGFTLHQKYARFGDLRVLKIRAGQAVADAIAGLKASGRYDFVEPDQLRYARIVPDDSSYVKQWSLTNTGQTSGTVGADIGAPAGWDILHDAPNVIVGIIDSGIRLTHSDLAANLWTNGAVGSNGDLHGIRYTGGTGRITSGTPTDDAGHGTHVSGIIGAVGNNTNGITGVAWKVQLMALKFLTTAGSGSTSDEIACINYAITHGVSIINASFGATTYSASEYAAISAARDAGIIFVAAAGNGDNNGVGFNTDLGGDYPAGYLLDNVVTVAATDEKDVLTTFSNFGAGTVDLAAPGNKIYSTYYSSDTSYQSLSGTSMAAPHVAGALALLKARFPNDTYRQLINRLLRTVTPLAALSGKVQSGGRLNLSTALASADNRPLNDDFANRATLSGANFRIRTSNAGATLESGESSAGGVATAGASLWWTWTAPATMQVSFDTTGSAYDTVLALYTGTSLSSLVPVASNDDAAPGTTTSRLTLNVTGGTTYQIAVAGKAGATGQTNLLISSVPPNDNFANAQTVTGPSFVLTTTSLNATSETGEPKPVPSAAGHSLWYKWVAPKAGPVLLSVYSATINPTAAVFTGTAINALTVVGSNDNVSAGNSSSLVSFSTAAGQTYYFDIDNTDSAGGNLVLSLLDGPWAYPTLGAVVSSPAAGSDGTIYFGAGSSVDASTPESRVHAVNPDGSVKWTVTMASGGTSYPFDVASPAIGTDGTVYIGSSNSFLYALTGATGARKWRFAAATAVSSSPALATDGTIYFHDDTALYALTDSSTAATLKWSFPYSGATYASPAIGLDGTVYLGGIGGSFYAITSGGAQKWVFTADGDIYTTAAIGADGTIYFGTLTGNFYALNPDGTPRWKWTAPAATSISSSPALGTDGTVYFAAYDHNLYALRSDGSQRWAFPAADQIRASSPAVGADGTIYFGDYDSQLYAVNPTGTLQRTYAAGQIIRSSPLIANNRLYFGSNDTKLYAVDLRQGAAASAWPMFRQNAIRVSRAVSVPVITAAPRSQTAGLGGALVLTAAASGAGPLSYQWSKDGVSIAGATSSIYSITTVTASAAGRYAVTVTANGGGSTTSAPATISTAAPVPSLLTNLSVQTTAGGDQTLTVGFVLSGGSGKKLLVRGVGPSLTAFGVNKPAVDPALTILGPSPSTVVAAANDNWNPSDTNAIAATGAFPLITASKDAALVTTLTAGGYTAQITAPTAGTVLAEVYDTAIGTGAKLINLSTLSQVSPDGPLTAGFTISGNVAKTVLIRGIGPALTGFGVAGPLSETTLSLYDSNSSLLQSNSGWGAAPALIAAFSQTGAFSLGTLPTKDSAILVTLAPGGYTALIGGVNSSSGIALVEIYEVP